MRIQKVNIFRDDNPILIFSKFCDAYITRFILLWKFKCVYAIIALPIKEVGEFFR